MQTQKHDWIEVNQFDSVCLMCGCKRKRYESYNIYTLGAVTGDSPIPCVYVEAEGKREWTFWYRLFRNEHTNAQRYWMKRERYKAALERKLESALNRAEAAEARAAQLETERDEARKQLDQARKWARVWKSAAKWQRLGASITFE